MNCEADDCVPTITMLHVGGSGTAAVGRRLVSLRSVTPPKPLPTSTENGWRAGYFPAVPLKSLSHLNSTKFGRGPAGINSNQVGGKQDLLSGKIR